MPLLWPLPRLRPVHATGRDTPAAGPAGRPGVAEHALDADAATRVPSGHLVPDHLARLARLDVDGYVDARTPNAERRTPMRVSAEQQLVRRTKLYQLLCQGKTLRAAQKTLKVSEPTVLADLKAISADLQAWAQEQQNHALAMALATYQRVIDEALAYAAWEHTTEKKWLAGGFDAHQVSEDGTTVVRKAPPLRTNKAALLGVVASATEKMTRLAGFTDHRVEVNTTLTGPDGGPVLVRPTYEPERESAVLAILVDAGVLVLPPAGLGPAGDRAAPDALRPAHADPPAAGLP